MLKSSQLDQEDDNIELDIVHAIPHIHPEVQYNWHIISQVSLKPSKNNSIKKLGSFPS